MSTAEVMPKATKETLEPMANTIAVANGILFDYYPIKLGEIRGPYRMLEKVPPIIVEGFVTVEKQVYHVSIKDFIRRRVNVSSAVTLANPAPTRATRNVVETDTTSGQLSASEFAEFAINEDVNLAWEDQIDTLRHLDDPEEEWITEVVA